MLPQAHENLVGGITGGVSSWAYEDQFPIYDLSLLIIGERIQILDGRVSFGGHIGVPSDNSIAWAISETKTQTPLSPHNSTPRAAFAILPMNINTMTPFRYFHVFQAARRWPRSL